VSDEVSTAEKIVEEVMIGLMIEREISERVIYAIFQASLTRGV
jgi:hypothetical protein